MSTDHRPRPGAPPGFRRLGYGTNGFTHHRLDAVPTVLAGLGHDGVALTLDHVRLDPYAPDLAGQVSRGARQLERYGLAVTVETGTPFLPSPPLMRQFRHAPHH